MSKMSNFDSQIHEAVIDAGWEPPYTYGYIDGKLGDSQVLRNIGFEILGEEVMGNTARWIVVIDEDGLCMEHLHGRFQWSLRYEPSMVLPSERDIDEEEKEIAAKSSNSWTEIE